MLELNNYYNTSIDNLKDFIIITFVIIDDIYQKVTLVYIKNRKNIDNAILSDSELLLLILKKHGLDSALKTLMIYFLTFAQELDFTELKNLYLIVVEQIRLELMSTLGYQYESLKVIDSMPIPVCKFGRAHFYKSFKPEASYGKCPSKKETYYGFKLHATIALDGFITNFTYYFC